MAGSSSSEERSPTPRPRSPERQGERDALRGINVHSAKGSVRSSPSRHTCVYCTHLAMRPRDEIACVLHAPAKKEGGALHWVAGTEGRPTTFNHPLPTLRRVAARRVSGRA